MHIISTLSVSVCEKEADRGVGGHSPTRSVRGALLSLLAPRARSPPLTQPSLTRRSVSRRAANMTTSVRASRFIGLFPARPLSCAGNLSLPTVAVGADEGCGAEWRMLLPVHRVPVSSVPSGNTVRVRHHQAAMIIYPRCASVCPAFEYYRVRASDARSR